MGRVRFRGAVRTAPVILALALGCASTTPPPAALAKPFLVPVAPPALSALVREAGAKATIVNVWATWCGPCVREFPDVLKAARAAAPRGVRMVFVSADFTDERPSAENFLREQGVDFPSYVKEGDDQAFIDALSPSWSGSIPATMIYDAQGNLRFFREGEIDAESLGAALDLVLSP